MIKVQEDDAFDPDFLTRPVLRVPVKVSKRVNNIGILLDFGKVPAPITTLAYLALSEMCHMVRRLAGERDVPHGAPASTTCCGRSSRSSKSWAWMRWKAAAAAWTSRPGARGVHRRRVYAITLRLVPYVARSSSTAYLPTPFDLKLVT